MTDRPTLTDQIIEAMAAAQARRLALDEETLIKVQRIEQSAKTILQRTFIDTWAKPDGRGHGGWILVTFSEDDLV